MKQNRQISIHHLLNKLKHGCDVLCLCKGLSPQFHQVVAVLVGTGVGVAGLCVAILKGYFGWSNSPGDSVQNGSSEFIYYVAGLQNLGSNCFLNVIMQALASCRCFYPFLQNILMDANLLLDQKAEKMPLRVALTSLLEDLCVVRDEKTVLNPRKVMLAMGNYVSSFNLTRQQDAAEAFLHLLSSLEEEVLQYYVPPDSSLADIVSLPSRIHQPRREGLSDCAQWQKHYIGPLVGTISSILACRSCSSVLSMDVESFYCLPLTPLRAKISDVVDGCTLVDCIKHFITPEHVENYRCGRCWHDSALKYMSSKSQKDEEKMETIRNCVKIDSCNCKSLFLPEEVMWHGFSDAVKRLRIARCPKILCIHLQRASMSSHGDLIKLQGYISFPQVLDLFPFTEVAIEMEQRTFFENTGKQGVSPQHLLPTHMQWKMQMLSQIYKFSGETIAPEASRKSKMQTSFCDPHANCFSISDGVPNSMETLIGGGSSSSPKKIQYRLSSVVEHYGRPESGHYAVYRRVSSDSVNSEIPGQQWLYISDDKVSRVSEESVFTAEASLLFYERLEEHL